MTISANPKRIRLAKIVLLYISIFALIGWIDSTLIHLKEIAGITDPNAFTSCHLNSVLDCGAVAKSKSSHFLGLPVSLIGIMFYEGAFFGTLAIWLGLSLPKWLRVSLSVLSIGALYFSFRLLYISWFGLGVLCPYCLVSNLSTLFVTVGWFWFNNLIKEG